MIAELRKSMMYSDHSKYTVIGVCVYVCVYVCVHEENTIEILK